MSLKFSQMQAAAALTGTEVVPVVQDGQNRKSTAQAIANLSAQVQSDWNVTDTSSKAFILNKPGLATNTTAGLMSASDKVRLDTLPTTPVTSISVTAPLTSTGGQTPTLGVLPAGTTSAGVIELATDAEVTAGLANNLAVPPSGLKVELDKKANQATTYTKTEVDIEIGEVETQLADKAPLNGVGTTGTWPISVTGSAGSASILSAGRTFSVSGDATGTSGAFNGSANVVIPLALANSGVVAGTYNDNPLAVRPFTVDAKGRVTGIGAAVTITPAFSSITGKPTTLAGYGITDAAPLASPAFTGVPTVPTAAVNTNTTQAASTAFVIAQIADDAPTKTGTGASGTWGISITGSSASTTGNAATATALSTARTFALTGDVTGSVSSDLTSGASIATAIGAGVIVNADVNASAAIAGTKVAPDFGAQDITTTGVSTAARFVPTSATVPTNGLYLPAANTVGIATGSSERVRIDSSGQVGIGVTPGAGFSFVVGSQITDSTAAQCITSQGTVQSGVTAAASYFRANISTAAAAFTCTNVRGYYAFFSSLGASSVITNLYGFFADSGLTQGTNNFGFYSNIAAATGRWNFYANGTAENYFGGNVKIGGTADRVTTAGTNQLVIFNGTAPVGTLTNGCSFYSTAGEMRVMDASGAATLLSPHDDDGYWIFDSTDTRNNRRLLVHMEKMAKWIDAQFGTNFVEEIGGPPVPV